jgi:hypothetical protein
MARGISSRLMANTHACIQLKQRTRFIKNLLPRTDLSSDATLKGLFTAIPASPLTFQYGLCRKALSVPFDDPLSVLDATGVANIDAIRGCKSFLVPV